MRKQKSANLLFHRTAERLETVANPRLHIHHPRDLPLIGSACVCERKKENDPNVPRRSGELECVRRLFANDVYARRDVAVRKGHAISGAEQLVI